MNIIFLCVFYCYKNNQHNQNRILVMKKTKPICKSIDKNQKLTIYQSNKNILFYVVTITKTPHLRYVKTKT